jgi:CheY-like chemotaxis protein
MSKKILIVEDELLIRELYEIVFKQRGFIVDSAKDGQEAFDKICKCENKYDMILLDVMLPKFDGITVLKKIKGQDCPNKTTPVFLLTNLGMDTIIKEALTLGAEQYIIKSNFLPNQIVDEVEKFLNNGGKTG